MAATLEGAPQELRVRYRDDNVDGILDVLISFTIGDMNITAGQTRATLTGTTIGGVIFGDTDAVIVG